MLTATLEVVLSIPMPFGRGNQVLERFCNLPNDTQMLKGRDRM